MVRVVLSTELRLSSVGAKCEFKSKSLQSTFAWTSGQRVGLAIRQFRVRVQLWPLAGFVVASPEFESRPRL